MLVVAAAFHDYVLALHIIAVIVAFGMLFIYPLLSAIGIRAEPGAMPWFHRFQLAVHTRVQAPALAVLVVAGVYLASDLHAWGDFFVGWGIVASIVIGGIGGAYIAPRERRLVALAESELAAVPAGGGAVSFGDEYRTAARQAELARYLQLAIAVVTIFFMALHLG
jgi:hypothetical protein